ncbi:hypothetical protein OKW96_12415 [Sphingobacterium sp. KU25419]|nr:hypothetical protein OKW96_12415 [Sphingobacterium sp. KU25419]
MLPFPQKMDVTGKFIENWDQLKPETLAIVVLKGQDIVFKSISILEGGFLQCRSLNQVYEVYSIPFEQVLEVWEFHSYHTTVLPETSTVMETVLQSLEEIKDLIASKA